MTPLITWCTIEANLSGLAALLKLTEVVLAWYNIGARNDSDWLINLQFLSSTFPLCFCWFGRNEGTTTTAVVYGMIGAVYRNAIVRGRWQIPSCGFWSRMTINFLKVFLQGRLESIKI
jgi:hypothetical protein